MNLLQENELELLFKINKHQLSELVFLDDEVNFLTGLLDKYFLSMINDVHINRIQLINSRLMQLNMVKSNITKDVLVHQRNLNSMLNHSSVDHLVSKSIDFLNIEHERMEDEIKDLSKLLKNIKKEIFAVYKNIHAEEFGNTHSLS